MSQPARDQLPATTQQMRPAPPTACLFLLTHLRNSLMANPPSLLCQELCFPNNHFPSSSPAPSQACMCLAARSWWASACRQIQRGSCTGRSGLVLSVFFSIVGSTSPQALLHSTTFKMLDAVLVFLLDAEQPTGRACCRATWCRALCTLLLATRYPGETLQSQPQHMLSLRPANHERPGLGLKYPDFPLCL